MAWNHRSAVVAVAIAIQPTPGTFVEPTIPDDLIAVSVPNNNYESITADDPTATGAVWRNRRIYLGRSGTAGATFPLRGPGGASPPAANAWPFGRVAQAAGFTEVINNASIAGAFQAGSTTTTVKLAAGASAVDDLYIGAPIQFAAAGTGFRATTMITDYNGTSKVATLGETIVAPAAADAYTIPKYLAYVLGTMTTSPPLLSIVIWRDKKRYAYKDWRPTSFSVDMPVTNDANQVFPSADFSGRGKPAGVTDATAPTLPSSIINIQPAPCRAGKWALNRVKLGHQSMRFVINVDLGAASNQNQDQGQDEYEITSGNRSITIDLNQMNVTDLDIDSLTDNQTVFPIISTWGLGAGNNWGVALPNNTLDPLNPGDRNGFVNLTGDAAPVDVDKSMAFAIWW